MAANPRLIDLKGETFGRWLVIDKAGNTKGGAALWLCRCSCGSENAVKGGDLRKGKSLSCGCEGSRIKIGGIRRSHGMTGTRLHTIWKGMHARCSQPRWKYHYGKGISVCAEWASFEAFRDWALANGYSDTLTIERINNAVGYSPSNCMWGDMKIQARNRSIVKRDTDGRPWAEIAESNGIPVTVFNNRMAAGGWPAEIAASWPVGKRRAKRERDSLGKWVSTENRLWRR